MKSKIIILIVVLISVGLISFGAYGLYLDKKGKSNDLPDWIDNSSESTPVDKDFEKMKE